MGLFAVLTALSMQDWPKTSCHLMISYHVLTSLLYCSSSSSHNLEFKKEEENGAEETEWKSVQLCPLLTFHI